MNRSKQSGRLAQIQSAAATVIECLENRLFLSSTVLGNQINLSASAAGITPQFDWLADINGDTKADLIVANSSNSISVLPGNGDGSFTSPATTYQVGGTPLPIMVGDFIANSQTPDIVVGTTGSQGTISILVGNGDGSFQSSIDIPALGSNHAIGLGRFIDNGNLDVVSVSNNATPSNNISIVFTDGTGHATGPATIFSIAHGGLSAVAVGNFGNGHDDIAVLSQTDNTVTVLLGNGDGTFQAPRDFKTGNSPTSLAVGDFNGDGKQDIVTANSTAGTVSFLAGNGAGSFSTKIDTHVAGSAANGGPLKVRATNFNNDGKTDLFCLLSTGGTGDATILLGQGNGTFQNLSPVHTGGTARNAIATGDLNGDGLTDIIISDPTQVTSLLNVTTTDTTPPTAAVDTVQVPGSTQAAVYQFTVTYSDAKQVDAQTLGDGNLIVNAPAGVTFAGGATSEAATLFSTGLVSGPTIDATYQIAFPTNLTSAYNGTYTVTINANTVTNAGNVAVPAGSIGTFALNVSSVQPPPPTVPPVNGGGGTTPPTPPSGDFTISAPSGKILPSVVTGSKQKSVKVVLTNTSGKLLTGPVVVRLFTSDTNLAVTGYGTFTQVAQFNKTVKKLKPGKTVKVTFKTFTYATAGQEYLVADALLNGVADSNDGATGSPITVAAAFVDANAVSASPVKSTIVAGKKSSAILTVQNLGNVAYKGSATVTVDALPVGGGTATNIASVPVKLNLKPGQSKPVRLTFTPGTLPATGSYQLVLTINVPGDTGAGNNVATTVGTVTI